MDVLALLDLLVPVLGALVVPGLVAGLVAARLGGSDRAAIIVLGLMLALIAGLTWSVWDGNEPASLIILVLVSIPAALSAVVGTLLGRARARRRGLIAHGRQQRSRGAPSGRVAQD